MPSTYSTSLRLELIGTGEQAGTWGTTTNLNLGTLIEQAISGVASVAMADANTTLTASNGISDQARNAVVTLTGALTATRNVTVPTATKHYWIRNNTTGSQSIVVKTAAGTGVTIAAGTSAPVYCDGTNVVQAGPAYNASTGAITAALTGNVTGTVTGAASLNVLKAGDTMTGALTISTGGLTVTAGGLTVTAGAVSFGAIPTGPASDPTLANELARKSYVDQRMPIAGGTFTGAVAISSGGINVTGGATIAGAVSVTGTLTASGQIQGEAVRCLIAAAPTTGQVVLGNGSARLYYDGTGFDLNGPLTATAATVGTVNGGAPFHTALTNTTVGQLVLAFQSGGVTTANGATIAGSFLTPASSTGGLGAGPLAGNWKNLGWSQNNNVSLWVRTV